MSQINLSNQRAIKNVLFSMMVLSLGACTKERFVSADGGLSQPVSNASPTVNQPIGDKDNNFVVLGKDSVKQGLKNNLLLKPNSAGGKVYLESIALKATEFLASQEVVAAAEAELRDESLTLAYPKSLLGERYVFGGVITALDDKENSTLGGLKLSDLTPTHVRTNVLSGKNGGFSFALLGCTEKCTESSAEEVVLEIPIVAVDAQKDQVILDLANLGDKLNLVQMMDPTGEYTKLQTKTSKTVSLDYSHSTLLFDVQVNMVPLVPPKPEQTAAITETVFTIRWYLRLASVFNPAFQSRTATEGVGYFMTERALVPHIIRHSLPLNGNKSEPGIKYYIKNVPEAHKPSFRSAFDAWNAQFKALNGKDLIQYEFIDVTEPKSKLVVTGDVRYRVLEWDLENRAGYGGLGPSIANQFTGEILTSNVLVQGPHIIKIYTEWFALSKKVAQMRAEGLVEEAELEIRNFVVAQENEAKRQSEGESKLALNLGEVGNGLAFKIHSQLAPLHDPLMQREDFDLVPEGATFESYMAGYFHDLVTHELGHNLGLRHNFRGNLYAAPGKPQQGKVSLSVMEYLGRAFRSFDDVGAYDRVALEYGYLGKAPLKLDQFCTDEDVPNAESPTKSAECSRDDATPDAYGFFVARLGRAVDLIIGRGLATAPVWKVNDMARELKPALLGVGLYSTTAAATSKKWTHFNAIEDRPTDPADISAFVLKQLTASLCPSDLTLVLSGKDATAQLATKTNLIELRSKAIELLAPLKILGPSDLPCQLDK